MRRGREALGFALALASCSGETKHRQPEPSQTSGTGGEAGDASGGASGGSTSSQPTSGDAGEASTGEGGLREPGGGDAGEAPMANEGGARTSPQPPHINAVKPSAGCGTPPAQVTGEFVKYTIETSGFKDETAAAHKKGAWSYVREYHVWLPPEYDPSHAYPLVIQAPNCAGTGDNVFSLSPTNDEQGIGLDGRVIRVGLTPPPNDIFHSTNPNQGCFDEREGDQSVEFVFYEKLIDRLQTEVCYDENRVFASSAGSGGWLANAFACKYAGNEEGYAVRGLAAVGPGGLDGGPRRPTCSGAPLAGMWIVPYQVNDPLYWRAGVDQALVANGCSATYYPLTVSNDFSVGPEHAPSTCQKVVGCPSLYPLVVCIVQSSAYDPALVNPAFAAFFSTFLVR